MGGRDGQGEKKMENVDFKEWVTDDVTQAGASAVDALRSVVISQQLLGTTEIVLVKHTGCGMLTFKNEDAYAIVEKNLGYAMLLSFLSFYSPPLLADPRPVGNTNLIGELKANLGGSAEATAELNEKKLDFLPFPELEAAVENDVAFLKASKLVPDSVVISGWVYEVETGKTRRVV